MSEINTIRINENDNKKAGLKEITNVNITKYGTVGNILSTYIDGYISNDEVKKINKKIDIMNRKLTDFNILDYKLSNRMKIRQLLVKALSEDSAIFMDLAVELLNVSEDNFENIVDAFLKLTKNDLDVLYRNLWKKRGNKKFDVISLKDEIDSNFEFVPDLIMSYEYRVNKDRFINNEKSLIIGDTLTLMPTQESSNIFNVFEKLSYNNLIKLSKYIPNKMNESFNTYLCFNFTYLGIYLCKLMKKIEKNKKEKE